MKVMELLHTEKGRDVYNTLVWGIEGVHYKRTGDDYYRVETLEYAASQASSTDSYGQWNWNLGNTMYSLLNQSSVEGYHDKLFKHNDSAVKTDLLGFAFDPTMVTAEMAQVATVVSEYKKPLQSGTLENWEAKYDEFINKLEAAGVQKVIDEVQSQVDAFVATK